MLIRSKKYHQNNYCNMLETECFYVVVKMQLGKPYTKVCTAAQ